MACQVMKSPWPSQQKNQVGFGNLRSQLFMNYANLHFRKGGFLGLIILAGTPFLTPDISVLKNFATFIHGSIFANSPSGSLCASDNANKEPRMIWTLVVGLIIGAIAKFLIPGKDPGGMIITMLLGVAGAFTANLIGSSMGYYDPNEPAGFVSSVIGAVILLAIYRAVIGRKSISYHKE
jgi:uncharacterized membrane protein YeaQ/YmgE (transglycosylase-associated protein family)